jgi:hypothetical protein
MGSLNDKVRKARRNATNLEASIAAGETINRNAKTAGVRLSMAEERAAKKVLQPRIKIDRERTAARGMAIEKIQEKKAAAKRAAAAIGNAPASKKSTAKENNKKTAAKEIARKAANVAKKAMVDPTSAVSKTAKSKASKQLTGDKAAEAMRKRTSPKGVKEYEKGAKKALEKKYPGLYKKSK